VAREIWPAARVVDGDKIGTYSCSSSATICSLWVKLKKAKKLLVS